MTKLFPLFPIISAFENTELVLLFAASIYCRLWSQCSSRQDDQSPHLPSHNYASLFKDADQALCRLPCHESSLPYQNCCLKIKHLNLLRLKEIIWSIETLPLVFLDVHIPVMCQNGLWYFLVKISGTNWRKA